MQKLLTTNVVWTREEMAALDAVLADYQARMKTLEAELAKKMFEPVISVEPCKECVKAEDRITELAYEVLKRSVEIKVLQDKESEIPIVEIDTLVQIAEAFNQLIVRQGHTPVRDNAVDRVKQWLAGQKRNP